MHNFAIPVKVVITLLLMLLGSVSPVNAEGSGKLIGQIPIDKVWGGTSVNYGATADTESVISAYYDRNRMLTVSRTSLADGDTVSVHLAEVFDGWDAHKNTVVRWSSDGVIHVFANMHDSPLVYYSTDNHGDIKKIKRAVIIGSEESHVTYPTVFESGRYLYFLYREGAAGAGSWLLDRYLDGHWTRVGSIFDSHLGDLNASAYPSPVSQDQDGDSHVAAVWRTSADVSSNFAVTYAKTRDFVTWTGVSGRSVRSPLNLATMDIVEQPGPNAGLLNNLRLVTVGTKPFIFYFKYAKDGRNVLILSTPMGGSTEAGWATREVVTSERRTEMSGGGSIPDMPRVHAELDRGVIKLTVSFPRQQTQRIFLDPDSLARVYRDHDEISAEASAPGVSFKGSVSNLPGTLTMTSTVFRSLSTVLVGRLSWQAQITQRDRPRLCAATVVTDCLLPYSVLSFTRYQ